jgi:hypothetical protein
MAVWQPRVARRFYQLAVDFVLRPQVSPRSRAGGGARGRRRCAIQHTAAAAGRRTLVLKRGGILLKNMTRAKVIGLWFAAVVVAIAASVVLGASVSTATGMLLVALCLVPPAIVLFMWPAVPSRTVAEVLHDVDGRG